MAKKTTFETAFPYIRSHQEHIDRVKQHADKHHEGNLSAAARAWAMSLPPVKKTKSISTINK